MTTAKGQDAQFRLNFYGTSHYNELKAMVQNEHPHFKGFLITRTQSQNNTDSCSVHVWYESTGLLIASAETEELTKGQIMYAKLLNSHAKCITTEPKIIMDESGRWYEAALEFAF